MKQTTELKRSAFKRKPFGAEPKKQLPRCAICKQRFEPLGKDRPAKACSVECSVELGIRDKARIAAAKARKERAEDKRRKEALKTNKDHLDITQRIINKYVLTKWRDMPCICCGKSAYDGVRNASHFKSRGSNSFLRFNLLNIWPCCYSCNVAKGGNIHEFRPALIKLIGQEKVDFLDNAPKSRTYTVEYLERMRRIFSKKTRRLER